MSLNLLDTAMEAAFGQEYLDLAALDKVKVLEDLEQANISAYEYQRRIWSGNLQAYADTL